MKDLDIAEVAKITGIPASTLRYYEEKGLIASHSRRGLRRVFDPGILTTLSLITLGQAAGFSLDDIGGMFRPDGQVSISRQTLKAKADELDRTITHLTALRDGLRHAATCPAQSHMECPTFLRLMKVAASRGARSRSPRRR